MIGQSDDIKYLHGKPETPKKKKAAPKKRAAKK